MELKNKDYYLAGAAIALASTAAIATYAEKRIKTGKSRAGLLLAGIAGCVVAALAVTEPTRAAARRLHVEDLLDDADTELMQTNISEVFGNSADVGAEPQKLRRIEVDEEASIEDFM